MPATKSKISLTFLGTGHHRDRQHSVLVSAHNKIEALARQPNSSVAAWLIDGPGCEGTDEHPTPGTYFYENGRKIPDPKKAKAKLLQFQYSLNQAYRLVTGEGIESSLLEATTYIQEIIDKNEGVLPEEINLQGFSRGADSCVRLANVIYLLYPDIKVNLFLVDPVPGPGRIDDPESFYMPPNIRNCEMTLMLDEHRKPYQLQHSDRYVFTNPNTRASFHYMAGRHGAGLSTKENLETMPRVTQTLVQDSLLKFNIETGVLPKDTVMDHWHKITTGKQIVAEKLEEPQGQLAPIERFGLLCSAMQDHTELANRFVVKLYPKRRIHKYRERYVFDADLFINEEHRALFKELFPATFNWFFEANTLLSGQKTPYTAGDVFAELQRLKHEPQLASTNFYQKLLDKFKISSQLDNLPEPQGMPGIVNNNFNQPLVRDELSYLQFCLRLIVSEYHYRVPSTWFGNWFAGQEDAIYKDSDSNKISRTIRTALQKSRYLLPEDAKTLLKETIMNIKARPNNGFFFREISKIIPDSKRYMKSILKVLNRYQALLPPAYANLIDKTIYLIQQQMSHSLKDDYQKRQKVQAYLISLSTAIYQLNARVSTKNVLCQELLGNLNQLSRPSYSEERVIDGVIRDLTSYRRRHTFLSYFPFSKLLGVYSPENIALTDELLNKLSQIRYAKTSHANLNKIEAILKDASLQYAQKHKKADTAGVFVFWKKHISFKANTLNKIIENHLKKVMQLSSLVFSIPEEKMSMSEEQQRNFHLSPGKLP